MLGGPRAPLGTGTEPYLPLQSSQRAKEQCGAIFCMRLAASRVTTTWTPITACAGTPRGHPGARGWGDTGTVPSPVPAGGSPGWGHPGCESSGQGPPGQ